MKTLHIWFLALVLGGVFTAAVRGEAPPVIEVAVGDRAPDIVLPNPEGGAYRSATVRLSELRGKNVLLAFYPKAFTPGCTKQMCGYRDDFSRFSGANTLVFAVSCDDADASAKFKKEYKLPFEVVSDPEGTIGATYGIPFRAVGGTRYAQRSVVLIDANGTVRYIDRQYDVEKGAEPLFDALGKLKTSEENES